MITFSSGSPWRRKAVGDPSDLDYSKLDEWVCPVYCEREADKRFVLDVVVDAVKIDPMFADLMAKTKAELVAMALNIAFENEDWRDFNCPAVMHPAWDF